MNKKETQSRIDDITNRILEVEAILQTCPEEEKEYYVDELAELECAKDSLISEYWDSQKDDTDELREFSNHIFN